MKFEDLRDYFHKTSGDDDIRLTCQATEEICNFLDQHIEKLDDDNVFHAFCLLVQIAVCSRDNRQSARGEVESLYSSLVISSETSILEFYRLGEAVALITGLSAEHGANSLLGCRLSLPFCESNSSEDSKPKSARRYSEIENSAMNDNLGSNAMRVNNSNMVIVYLSTMAHLFAIQRFWSNVLLRILTTKFNVPINFSLQNCLLTLTTIFSNLHDMDALASTVTSVCTTITYALEGKNPLVQSSSIPYTVRTTIALDVLKWLSGLFGYCPMCLLSFLSNI